MTYSFCGTDDPYPITNKTSAQDNILYEASLNYRPHYTVCISFFLLLSSPYDRQ